MELSSGEKAGEICKKIKVNLKQFLDNYDIGDKINLLTIVKYIEDSIIENAQNNDSLMTPIAFPVGVSVNNVCAHDTCIDDKDPRTFNLSQDIIKIDFGIQINGIIIDNAFSYSRNPKYNLLIEASKTMVHKVIDHIKANMRITEIQDLAEATLKQFNSNNGTNFVAISNLAGHLIKPNIIHGDPKQLIYPNSLVNKDNDIKIQGNSFYAIEFFVSTGSNMFPEMDESTNSHFMINPSKLKKFSKMKIHNEIYDRIRKTILIQKGTLAFSQRFIHQCSSIDFKDINEALDYFFDLGIISKFPPVLDKNNPESRVSQHEVTIYVPKDITKNIKILSE